MHKKIFDIVMFRTDNDYFLDLEDYNEIIDILISGKDLKNYIKIFSVSNKKSTYRSLNKILNIGLNEIEAYKKVRLNLTNHNSIICFENLYSSFPILHEIEHVVQSKRIKEEHNDFETKLLSLSMFGKLPSKDKILFGMHSDKFLEGYYNHHDLFTFERCANICASKGIIEIADSLDSDYNDIYNELILLYLMFYTVDYRECTNPLRKSYEVINRLDLYESIKDEVASLPLEKRLKYGFEVSVKEQNYFINNTYSLMKRG